MSTAASVPSGPAETHFVRVGIENMVGGMQLQCGAWPAGSLGAAVAAAAEEPQAAANQQTAMRLLSNACQGQQLASWVLKHAQVSCTARNWL